MVGLEDDITQTAEHSSAESREEEDMKFVDVLPHVIESENEEETEDQWSPDRVFAMDFS